MRYQFTPSRAIVGDMYIKETTLPRKRSWRLLLGVLCIGLVILGSTLSVAHTHNQGDVRHGDCALCVTAHVVVQPAAVYVAIDIAQVFTPVHVPLSSTPSQNISQFALFTRPPPVDLVLA